MATRLSICFAAYNQTELLRRNLNMLANCPHDCIEVVVSDDCSTENLKELVGSYDDARFKYVRTPTNLGHDGNILFGIQHCSSDYVMLMRSRDSVIPQAIPAIANTIAANPDAGYYLLSARDEAGQPRLQLADHIYERGPQTVWAQSHLLIHPSGGIYNRRALRPNLYDAYCKAYFENTYGFVAHQLMRADASAFGEFVTSSTFAWTYANTLKATDVAVNSTSDRSSVYAPEYVRERYVCEFDFARFELDRSMSLAHMVGVLQRYYEFFLYHMPIVLGSKSYARHYNSETLSYDAFGQMPILHRLTAHLADGLDEECRATIARAERQEFAKACTLYPTMRAMRKALAACPPLDTAYRKTIEAIKG